MGDEDGGDAGLALDAPQLLPGLEPEPGIQVGKRLVQQQHPGHFYESPGDGHPLLLPAGHLAGLPVQERVNLDKLCRLRRPADHLLFAGPVLALQVFQGEQDVLQHGHVGIQGVVLEHQPHAPVFRGQMGHVLAPKENLPGGGGLQAANHVKRGAFAAPGGAQKPHQLAIRNFIGKVGNGDDLAALLFVPIGKFLGQVL